MDECREAIPVWIMPRYLVAEMVNPTSTRYDIIIVDEASQLGAESLFLFYIAKKMVVVGDDQQISPYGVGIADQEVVDLQHHYLEGVRFKTALSAQSSLYANAKIRFQESVVLREHFRCMPEIIQFSNDLCYASNGTPLDPLRTYTANRLTPLVLRHQPDGYRTGSSQYAINEPEADAILRQIEACIVDPRYAGKTMGVISLQGEAQAKLIERKLLETLEPECIEERRLICGDAYAFQGDERHIIFLSMVAAAGDRRIGALANEAARQRFNVAASRAQDQLWLFHSATLDILSPACMRHNLLSYMLNPTRTASDENERKFESDFERHVFGLISERGFHVRTQVCVGDPTNHRYRIDLVVEGMQGRLAVECDGDQWHGPERHEQDTARQRDLERAGWQFVRIRGGDFYRDRAKAMEPVWAELERLGIKSGGVDEAAGEPPAPAPSHDDGQNSEDELVGEIARPVMDDSNSDEIEAVNHVEATDSVEVAVVAAERQTLPETLEIITPRVAQNNAREAIPIADDLPSRPGLDPLSSERAAQPNASVRAFQVVPEDSQTPKTDFFFSEYVSYRGKATPDPRIVSLGVVAEGLCRIVEVEGPMIARRAYDIYLRGCGIKRLGGELRSTMNRALTVAIRQGHIVSQNEPGQAGVILSTVSIKGTPSVKVRTRGPRTFEEIPAAELRAVGQYLLECQRLEPKTEEHMRAILECFELKRLTAQVSAALLKL